MSGEEVIIARQVEVTLATAVSFGGVFHRKGATITVDEKLAAELEREGALVPGSALDADRLRGDIAALTARLSYLEGAVVVHQADLEWFNGRLLAVENGATPAPDSIPAAPVQAAGDEPPAAAKEKRPGSKG